MTILKNTVVTAVVVIILNLMGWLNITHTFPLTEGNQFLNIALSAVIIAFLYNVIMMLLDLALIFFAAATCLIGCILFPVYALGGASLIALYGVVTLLPGWTDTTGSVGFQLWLLLMILYWIRPNATTFVKQSVSYVETTQRRVAS